MPVFEQVVASMSRCSWRTPFLYCWILLSARIFKELCRLRAVTEDLAPQRRSQLYLKMPTCSSLNGCWPEVAVLLLGSIYLRRANSKHTSLAERLGLLLQLRPVHLENISCCGKRHWCLPKRPRHQLCSCSFDVTDRSCGSVASARKRRKGCKSAKSEPLQRGIDGSTFIFSGWIGRHQGVVSFC